VKNIAFVTLFCWLSTATVAVAACPPGSTEAATIMSPTDVFVRVYRGGQALRLTHATPLCNNDIVESGDEPVTLQVRGADAATTLAPNMTFEVPSRLEQLIHYLPDWAHFWTRERGAQTETAVTLGEDPFEFPIAGLADGQAQLRHRTRLYLPVARSPRETILTLIRPDGTTWRVIPVPADETLIRIDRLPDETGQWRVLQDDSVHQITGAFTLSSTGPAPSAEAQSFAARAPARDRALALACFSGGAFALEALQGGSDNLTRQRLVTLTYWSAGENGSLCASG
jgi:hypothetical protein